MFSLVYKFNKEVVQIGDRELRKLSAKEKQWLVGALKEEADELSLAVEMEDQVDALVDSIIFAIGGLARLGLTEQQAQECFAAVMAANFEKKAGVKATRAVDGVADAIKPQGWVGPEQRIQEILNV